MKITLAFVHKGPGRGEVRARVYANGAKAETLTVGNYGYRQEADDWIAYLWAVPGESSALIPDGVITASDVARLSNAAAGRGKWWE